MSNSLPSIGYFSHFFFDSVVVVFVALFFPSIFATQILNYRTYSIVSSRILMGMRVLETNPDETEQSRVTTLAFQSGAQPGESTIGFQNT